MMWILIEFLFSVVQLVSLWYFFEIKKRRRDERYPLWAKILLDNLRRLKESQGISRNLKESQGISEINKNLDAVGSCKQSSTNVEKGWCLFISNSSVHTTFIEIFSSYPPSKKSFISLFSSSFCSSEIRSFCSFLKRFFIFLR